MSLDIAKLACVQYNVGTNSRDAHDVSHEQKCLAKIVLPGAFHVDMFLYRINYRFRYL